jgi:hypothetical protein
MFGSSRSRRGDIPSGQLFRAIGGGTWEYTGEAPTVAPEPHARLVRPGDPRTIKIISYDALTDTSLFERVS